MIDLHCDALSRAWEEKTNLWENDGQWDVKRARLVGTTLQVLALFTKPETPEVDWERITQQIRYLEQQIEQESMQSKTFLIRTKEDLAVGLEQKKMGLLLHLEGGDALGKNLDLLEQLDEWGVRSMGLTWNYRNALAAGALEYPHDTGLSPYGRELIHGLNERNILLDLAHASRNTFFQALEVTQKPAYVSHANIEQLCRHPRNLTDEQIKAIAAQGGIVGLTYYREFLAPENAGINHLIDHMVYVAELVGCETLALGSDFDGAQDMVFPGVIETFVLRENMQKRGFFPEEIEKILETNAKHYLAINL